MQNQLRLAPSKGKQSHDQVWPLPKLSHPWPQGQGKMLHLGRCSGQHTNLHLYFHLKLKNWMKTLKPVLRKSLSTTIKQFEIWDALLIPGHTPHKAPCSCTEICEAWGYKSDLPSLVHFLVPARSPFQVLTTTLRGQWPESPGYLTPLWSFHWTGELTSYPIKGARKYFLGFPTAITN